MTNKEEQAYLDYLQAFCKARGYYRERAKKYYQAGKREDGDRYTSYVKETSKEVQIIQEVGKCMGIPWDVVSAAIDAAEAKGEKSAADSWEVMIYA